MDTLLTLVITFIIMFVLLSIVNLGVLYFSKGKKHNDFKVILIQSLVIVIAFFIYREFISG